MSNSGREEPFSFLFFFPLEGRVDAEGVEAQVPGASISPELSPRAGEYPPIHQPKQS